MAPQGDGDVIPLPVYQGGPWAPGSRPSHRTASMLGAGPRPPAPPPEPGHRGHWGAVLPRRRTSLVPGRRSQRRETTRPLSSPLWEMNHSRGKCQEGGEPMRRQRGGERGRRAGAFESPWTPALEHLLLPGFGRQHRETGSGQWPSLLFSRSCQWQLVSGRDIWVYSLAPFM